MQFLELWLREIIQGDTQLYWPVIAPMHLVQTPVEVRPPLARHVRLEDTSVAVGRRLTFLINIGHLVRAHLVAGKESNGLLYIARIVSL